jgi:hypothetical protein
MGGIGGGLIDNNVGLPVPLMAPVGGDVMSFDNNNNNQGGFNQPPPLQN